MENKNHALLILLAATLLSISKAHDSQHLSIVHGGPLNTTKPQVYIVHVQKQNDTRFLRFSDRRSWYTSFLPNTTLDSGEPRMIYAYRHAISGFAARLTKKEVKAMEAMDGFLQAYPDKTLTMHTTYTPEFLGLSQWDGIWPTTGFGGGKIIGVIDTGVKPTHPSFKDDGMAPRPTTWAGKCYWGRPICNNKLIGAVGYRYGFYSSPDDNDGHGTHTASTAAGAFVDDAEVLGSGKGQASGMAPRAHLAIYKVIFKKGSKSTAESTDTLKGIDEAIRDHVDILSMSLGSGPEPLYDDTIAIGSFAAMEKGIVPVAAAGNNGTLFQSMLSNDAPWILTVGASSTDRRIRAVVELGNGEKFYGESAYQPDTFVDAQLPLVYPGVNKTQETLSCQAGSMQGFDVKGKIVLCGTGHTDNTEKGEVVKKAGGAGMIVMNQPWQGNTTNADAHVIPTSHVSFKDAWAILTYFQSDANPTASITFEGTKFGAPLSPAVSDFSSTGPSLINGGIIKPDIIAPGVNVLAAWPFQLGPNPSPTKPTSKTFRFVSGTSMATPHVAGIVALLKNSHPQWSPAAIKSALMTTAYVKDREGNPIAHQARGVATAFTMGSGHINPVAANDPGLIYDLQYYDYVHYLCGIGYTDTQVSAIIRGTAQFQCSLVKKISAEQLNYPSFLVSLNPSSPTVTVTRTVTNVGDAQETYSLDFNEPQHVSMVVTPLTLKFSKVDEQMSYSVTFAFKGNPPAKGLFSEGYLSWVSGKHAVRSPVVTTFT